MLDPPETLRRRLFRGECRDLRSVAGLPAAIKGEVRAFPEWFQHTQKARSWRASSSPRRRSRVAVIDLVLGEIGRSFPKRLVAKFVDSGHDNHADTRPSTTPSVMRCLRTGVFKKYEGLRVTKRPILISIHQPHFAKPAVCCTKSGAPITALLRGVMRAPRRRRRTILRLQRPTRKMAA